MSNPIPANVPNAVMSAFKGAGDTERVYFAEGDHLCALKVIRPNSRSKEYPNSVVATLKVIESTVHKPGEMISLFWDLGDANYGEKNARQLRKFVTALLGSSDKDGTNTDFAALLGNDNPGAGIKIKVLAERNQKKSTDGTPIYGPDGKPVYRKTLDFTFSHIENQTEAEIKATRDTL